MIIILRQFCLQLILKRPSTQLIIVFCSQSKSFGFGPDFIQWVRALFKNSESCLTKNDFSQGILHWKEELVKKTHFQLTFSFLHNKLRLLK